MIGVDLRPGECNGGVAVVLRGELGVAGAASAAAVVPAGAACEHEVIAGLAGPEFISCSGLRVLQRVRMLRPGGRAGGWVSHPHRCDMISAGSSVSRLGRYAATHEPWHLGRGPGPAQPGSMRAVRGVCGWVRRRAAAAARQPAAGLRAGCCRSAARAWPGPVTDRRPPATPSTATQPGSGREPVPGYRRGCWQFSPPGGAGTTCVLCSSAPAGQATSAS
jgi:hypothetical protein